MRILSVAVLLVTGCSGLELNLVEGAHNRPSNVAVYFTVDTRDGEPVPGLQASDFRIYEDGELVSVDESRQTIVNPEVAAEHYTLLLVDMSGSVTESEQVPLIEEAATEFTSTLESYQKVAVYAFDGSEDIYVITPFAGASQAAAAAGRLSGFQGRDPSTNLHGALIKAEEELDEALERSRVPLRIGTLVVFTDGSDRAARVPLDDALDRLDEGGHDTFAIGVGNEIDEHSLSRVGRSGYVLVEDRNAVVQAFQAVSQRIVGQTQRYYLLSYCSPARAGLHTVTIEAVTPDDTGTLDYQFDATNFGPNCNPETPPPFDTTGRGRVYRRRPTRETGTRIEVRATTGGGGGNPESGDY